MLNRYDDMNKFITDIDKLRMDKYGTVYISEEEDYGISVCLEEQMKRFEELKPVIIKVAEHICELIMLFKGIIKSVVKILKNIIKSIIILMILKIIW